MSKVSVVIPARNEKFLAPTVNEVLTKARGDIEVVVHLDGYWPDPPLKEDKRLKLIHRGRARGMRPGINAAVAASTGDYIMKLDGHCVLDEGYDEKLKADCEDDWLVTPRRHRLDVDNWVINDGGRGPIDAHYLSYPLENDLVTTGLHGTEWKQRMKERADVLIDDEMSSQGSCYFLHRKFWDRIGPLDVANWGTFSQEHQEIGNRAWLSGGRVVINKRTFYGHWHKGKEAPGKSGGRGYSISRRDHALGHDYVNKWFMLEDRKSVV